MPNGYVLAAQKQVDNGNVMQSLLALHPKQVELNKHYQAYRGTDYDGQPFVLNPKMVVDEDRSYFGRYQVNFSYQPMKDLKMINLCLDLYPHCCALHQLNNFSHGNAHYIDPDFFVAFVEEAIHQYFMVVNQPRRLMINFVEWSRIGDFKPEQQDIPPSEKAQINYPLFYQWAKKHQHIETLFVNHNTGRIIHNTIITL